MRVRACACARAVGRVSPALEGGRASFCSRMRDEFCRSGQVLTSFFVSFGEMMTSRFFFSLLFLVARLHSILFALWVWQVG